MSHVVNLFYICILLLSSVCNNNSFRLFHNSQLILSNNLQKFTLKTDWPAVTVGWSNKN